MDNSPILLSVARRLRSDEVSSGNEESSGWTDIHTAARRKNLKVVQACVNNDAAKRDAKTADGETPLMIAALNGCLEVVDWLHRRGASLREVLTNGNTVVHYSAASGSTDTLQYILIQEGMGHYVNSLNKRGETPAHVAVRCGSIETLRVLFNHRADLTVMNQDSQTACDLAKALGHPECRQFLVQSEHPQPHQLPAAITTEEDPDGNVRRSGESTSPPVSLQNDERQAFHNEEGVERDLLVQGNNTSSRGRARGGNGDTAEGQSQPTIPAASSQPATTVTEADTRQKSFGGGGGNVPLAPLEPMRPKTTGERTLPAKEEQRGERGSQVHTSHSKTSLEKDRKRGEEACVTQSVPVASNVVVLPHNICPMCGRRTTARTFVINKPKLIYAGETCVQEADSVQYEEQTCFYCTQEAMKAAQGPSPTARRERRGSDKSQRRRGSEIDRTHSLSMDSTDGHDATEEESSDEDGDGGCNQNLESGYFTLPSNSIPPGPERAESPSLVEIREHKIPVPARMEVKHGEYVSLYAKATPKCSQPLKYSWFTIKGGRPDRVIGTRPRLRYRVTREVKLLCRVSLKHNETVAVDSKQVSITPKLVWITSSLTMEGEQYFGRRAVLKCTAEKHPSVDDTIRYQWLRNTLPSQIPWFYKETESPTLTFDPLSPEHDGYYLCQAEVKGDFAETKPVHVQGRIEPLVEVVRQPRSWVLREGDSLQLHCLAALRDGGDSDSLSYQWLHDDSPIHGATSSSYKMERLTVDDTGQYRCRVSERRGGAVTSEPATVALAHSQETDSTGPRSLQQKQQLRAQKVQQTEDESRYATDKVALLVGNEDYRHQSQLNSSVADVRALQEALKDAGFKVSSLDSFLFLHITYSSRRYTVASHEEEQCAMDLATNNF
jgi:hypothetical protein